jgi:hypothetical protein
MSQLRTLAMNSSNDIYLSGGDFAYANGKDAYATIITAALRTVKGELKDDPNVGIPYFETIFDSQASLNTWKIAMISRVKAFDFVKDVKSFETSYNRSTSTLSYTMEIETDNGEVVITGNQ